MFQKNTGKSGLKTILFSVTTDQSWPFIEGFPELLVEQGWIVHLVSNPGNNLDKYRLQPGIHAHPIKMKRNPAPIHDFVALVNWFIILWKIRPTIISVGTPKAALLGLTASYVVRIPHRVYVLHGLRLETARGVFRLILNSFEKISMLLATNIISVSSSLRSRVVELGLVKGSKIQVVGVGSTNGINLRKYSLENNPTWQIQQLKKSLGIQNEDPVLGFVGRLTADKGLRVLTSARKILAEWKVPYQLIIVGSQDDASEVDALSQIDEYGAKAIRVGWVDNVAPYYQLMDYLVFPTFREGLSGVVLEALASGVPVISTKATGVVDLVKESITGILVPLNDPLALANAIRECVNGDLKLRRSEEIKHSAKPYAREIVQKKYIEFYSSLI